MFSLHLGRRSGERSGRANFWSGDEEDLRHANADTAPQKEDNYRCDEKEIAYADSFRKIIAHRKGIADPIAFDFAEKEKVFAVTGGRIAIARSEKEKRFTDANANLVAAS